MMMSKQKLDDYIESDPRHNIFAALIVILGIGGIGLYVFVKIIQEILLLF